MDKVSLYRVVVVLSGILALLHGLPRQPSRRNLVRPVPAQLVPVAG